MNRKHFLKVAGSTIASALLINKLSPVSAINSNSMESSGQSELSYHKIANIQFTDVTMRYPRLVGKNSRLDIHGWGPTTKVAVITTDKGAKGWGTIRGNYKDFEAKLDYFIGKKISVLFAAEIGIIHENAIPVDLALHDLAGVILNKPVYQLLGKTKNPITTNCYSGMIYFDDLEPGENPRGLDQIIKECRYDYDYGYRQFKLKIGRGGKWMSEDKGLRRDIEVTRLVAKNFPDCGILVDANDAFNIDLFIEYLKGVQGIPLFWIEEPFPETVADYMKLRQWMKENNLKSLLADGEAKPDPILLRELEDKKLIDVNLSDILGLGFTAWRSLMPDLQKRGIQGSPHNWGTRLKECYTSHLVGGLGNSPTIEGVTCDSDDVDFSGYTLQNGHRIPSSKPGFGLKLLKTI